MRHIRLNSNVSRNKAFLVIKHRLFTTFINFCLKNLNFICKENIPANYKRQLGTGVLTNSEKTNVEHFHKQGQINLNIWLKKKNKYYEILNDLSELSITKI